ncbi:MAG: domain containing protein [Dactylosporangium sp.]|nr:domain containing protein [Dactylosporangium sp.]
MLEEERKYEVHPSFSLPDLTGCLPEGGRLVPRSPVILRTTYYYKVGRVLRGAGAVEGDFVPKHVRAMGSDASHLAAPSGRGSAKATAAGVVTDALRRDITRIFGYDPLVRLGHPLSDGDTAVHQMRVGCRRLRTDLRTFRPLLDAAWADGLRAGLSWLADMLGGVRDAEVLRERLCRSAATDPVAPLDDAAVARIDADLAARQEESLSCLEKALTSRRYLDLLERLLDAARAPQLAPEAAGRRAREVLPGLVNRPWRKVGHASELSMGDPDTAWHSVRIQSKRAQYAVDAAIAADTWLAVAADTWLAVARAHPDDHALAVTAGRLYERERATIRRVRKRFPAAWKAANRPRLTDWLSS